MEAEIDRYRYFYMILPIDKYLVTANNIDDESNIISENNLTSHACKRVQLHASRNAIIICSIQKASPRIVNELIILCGCSRAFCKYRTAAEICFCAFLSPDQVELFQQSVGHLNPFSKKDAHICKTDKITKLTISSTCLTSCRIYVLIDSWAFQ